MPRLAADLVARKVAVIVTVGGPEVAVGAKATTSTTPVVFMLDEDPIEYGLVASFNCPAALSGLMQRSERLRCGPTGGLQGVSECRAECGPYLTSPLTRATRPMKRAHPMTFGREGKAAGPAATVADAERLLRERASEWLIDQMNQEGVVRMNNSSRPCIL